VLLCPRPLGLLSLGGPALAALRTAFNGGKPPVLEGLASVTYHPFGGVESGECVVQNFNGRAVDVSLTLPADGIRVVDRFSGTPISGRAGRVGDGVQLTFAIPARSRVWVQPE
jgi:hypothetical protein